MSVIWGLVQNPELSRHGLWVGWKAILLNDVTVSCNKSDLISYHVPRSVSLIYEIHQSVMRKEPGALQRRHNGRGSVSNHQPHDCLLNRLFRRRSKKTSKLCVTGLCAGEFTGDRGIPRTKWPVTRKMFPLDDVIMERASVLWRHGW